jgi:hypothetical protein
LSLRLHGVGRIVARGHGLMSYGVSIFDVWRRVAVYVDKILKGGILGIVDGLRLATVFDRAQVDRTAVMNCVQRLGPETLPRLIESYLDAVEIDEPALPFYLWDALVATCPKATPQAIGTRREDDTASWVFVSLPHPTTTSRPFFSRSTTVNQS